MAPLILVIDDNPDVTHVVCLLLQSRGYEAVAAPSGEAALKMMEARRPDLILCDIMMPGMDGLQVFQRVRGDRRWQMIPFVFLTALTDSQVRFSTTELGVEAFVTKPFNKQELLALISGLLRRAHELQTRTASEMDSFKEQLLFMITHELNTPLSVLRMMTDSMRSNYSRFSPAQMGEYLDLLSRSTGELSSIVDSMLLALQIDSGRTQELFDKFAGLQTVRTVMEAVLVQAAAKARELGVVVSAEGLQEALWVRAHEQQLMQIFGRILDNAIRFSPKGGRVVVRLSREGERARISFVDQGPGLTPDEIDLAFDRLRQINRAQQEQQGVGLSLSLVRSLATIQGGEITVNSTPGKGSTFNVWLPLVPAPV
jgi:two-component system, sensor histidine kinase and response regulator